jgi:Fe-S-cluster containining protein
MIPANWEKDAKDRQKLYKRQLEKGDKNKMLRALTDLHEEVFSKHPDIKRIAKVLRIKEGDLVAQYLKLDTDGDYITKSSPCPFLADDNTCNIYEDRPSDCRRYPYTDEDVFVKRVQLTLKNATVCPAAFNVMEALMKIG